MNKILCGLSLYLFAWINVAVAGTTVSMVSDVGDYIGAGGTYLLNEGTGTFSVREPPINSILARATNAR